MGEGVYKLFRGWLHEEVFRYYVDRWRMGTWASLCIKLFSCLATIPKLQSRLGEAETFISQWQKWSSLIRQAGTNDLRASLAKIPGADRCQHWVGLTYNRYAVEVNANLKANLDTANSSHTFSWSRVSQAADLYTTTVNSITTISISIMEIIMEITIISIAKQTQQITRREEATKISKKIKINKIKQFK